MKTMPAVGLRRYLPIDDPESLLDLQLPVPEPGPRDLRVRVEAVSVNPVDTKLRAPKDGEEDPPRVLGYDVAGVVDAVGAEVGGFEVGDAVYYAGDVTRPGGNSRYHVVDERIVARKPHSLDFAQAAAIPLTAITAWEALFDRLGIILGDSPAEQSLLIIGGAGGVGSIGIQLARLAGLSVIATASRPETAEWCRALGASLVIDHSRPLAPQLEEAGIEQVDLVANFNDTDQHWPQILEVLKPQGRVVTIVDNTKPLDTRLAKTKCITHVWEFMFCRPKYQTADMAEQGHALQRIAELIDNGQLRGTMAEALSPINAETLRQAHRRLEGGRMIGKLVVQGWPDEGADLG